MSLLFSNQKRFYKPGVNLEQKDIKLIKYLNENGKTVSEIVNETGISKSTVIKYIHNDIPNVTGKRKPDIMTEEVLQHILYFVEKQPSIQIREIQNKLIDNGICIQENCPSLASICSCMKNDLLLTRKKIRSIAKESKTENVEGKLDEFIDFISQTNSDRLHFFDESSFLKNSGNRKFGHSLYGTEAIEIQRFASNATLTLNLLHGKRGVDYFNLVEGPSDSLHLLRFFTEVFDQMLHGPPILVPGDIVVMDNCRFHHSRLIQNQLQYLFTLNGVSLKYQPPYHPELNSCEYCFKIIKDGIVRKNRFYEEHMALAIADSVIDNVTQAASENIFHNCGYI